MAKPIVIGGKLSRIRRPTARTIQGDLLGRRDNGDDAKRAQVRPFHLRRADIVALVDRRMYWAFFVLVAVLMTGLVAGYLPQSAETRLTLLASQQLLFVIGGIGGTGGKFKGVLGRKTLIHGLLSGAGLYVVNTVLGMFSVWVARGLFDYDLVQNLIERERAGVALLLASNKPLIFFGTCLLLTIGAPLGEELFFRGLLVDLWAERYGTKKAIFFAALIFAFLHFYVLQFIPVLISGILLGIIFVRSKNIFVPIIAHSAVNSLVLLIWLFGS